MNAPIESRILHRTLSAVPPVVVSGQGMELIDAQGRRYLDACGGAAVSCLGHGHPDVQAAMHAQIDRLAWTHTGFFTTEVAEQLAATLVASAPAGISHAYFVSGGSEAVEAALKMARQFFLEQGQPQRSHFIARRQSYHGNTLGALAIGGNLARREAFAPLLMPATHVSPCYAYREQHAHETPEAYGLRLAEELEAAILQIGAERVIGFVAETERQVDGHIDDHRGRLPQADARSRAILEAMRHDEIVHGESARNAGGTELPAPAREAMRATSHVMTFTSYWV